MRHPCRPRRAHRLLASLCVVLAAATQAQSKSELDQLDAADRAEFSAHMARATGCTERRDFVCADRELAQARKFANGSGDRSRLAAGAQNLELARELALRDDARRKYSGERAALDANTRDAEAELEESRRSRGAANSRAAREQMQQQGALDQADRNEAAARRQQAATQNARIFSDAADVLRRADRQTAAAMTESRRVQIEQAAQRERAAGHKAQADIDDARAQQRQLSERQAEQRARADPQERDRARAAAAAEEKAAEEKKKDDYFAGLARGIRLVATTCPGGAGQYYVTGVLPKVMPRGSFCSDVQYEATCPGGVSAVRGTAHNFVGMSGCFGDTYPIAPKPACDVKQVSVRVLQVKECP